MKKALISGITGQDGAYLAEFLLQQGYEVHGIKRRASLFNTERIEHLYQDPHQQNVHFFLHYGDLTDSTNLIRLVQQVQPDEIYNLAAQSHVKVSFDTPEYTANTDGLGTLRLLEAIRILGLEEKTRYYQASTSELYGQVAEIPQCETTPFYPRSPYAAAKLYAYWITVNYRESYNLFACNGILFNHESPLRGETFVTRKITRAVARIKLGIDINWNGSGGDETGVDKATGKTLVRIDPRYFRPTEVELLLGNAEKIKEKLGWQPQLSFPELVRIMVEADLKLAEKDRLCASQGFVLPQYND